MIRTIAIQAGEGDCGNITLQHALVFAKLFHSKLRIVSVAESSQGHSIHDHEDDAPELVQQMAERLLGKSSSEGVPAEASYHGEGSVKAMLAEAQASDLLVVDMPTEALAAEDSDARDALHEKLPLIRKAECLILVVCGSPQPLRRILVYNHGGIEGKMALRTAAELAERAQAEVMVFAVGRTIVEATILASTAERYLRGYCIPKVTTIERGGEADSETDVVATADTVAADLIVIGEDPYGILSGFFGGITAEEMVEATRLPVLIAR